MTNYTFFNPNEWCLNSKGDMMFNINTYKTIRCRMWIDKTNAVEPDNFRYFSFHDLNSSQAIGFLFADMEDAAKVHKQSVGNNFNFDMVDIEMWTELDNIFTNGFVHDWDKEEYL